MDSGLGVRWPLSPYATALAAGALFAFCLALWKHSYGTRKRARKDPKGQRFGKDLDPTKKQDVPDKPGKEKKESEADKFTNFPVLTLRDARRVFSYEQLCVSGQFGAIPRTQQRRQSLESPNLYSAFRRRNAKKENKNWPEFNPASSYIYQQPFSFGSDIPRLSAKLLLNISPKLNSYFNQAKETPGVSRKSYFDDFDVSIKPEILKNKPITRSAVCLALEQQLHKFLDEPFHEVKLIERAIQTTEENGNRDPADNTKERDLNFDSDSYDDVGLRPNSTESEKKTSADSSLWDSGYGERAFEERSNTPRDYSKDDKIEECSGESSNEPSITSDNFISCNYLSDNNLVTSDSKTLNNYDINTCSNSTDKSDKSNTLTNKLDSESSDVEILYEEIATKTSLNICDMTTCPESEGKTDESNTHTKKLDSEIINVKTHYKEIENSTVEENTKVLNANECSDENLLKCREEIQVGSVEESIFRCPDNNTDSNISLNICDRNTCPESEDKLYESNTQTNQLNFQTSDVEILFKDIENSTEVNTNTSSIKECSNESLLKCKDEIRCNFNEENILRDTDNSTDDIKTVNICDTNASLKSDDKSDIPNAQINKLDFQNSNAEISSKEIQKSNEENANTSSVTECLDENLLKCREEMQCDSNDENILRDTDNLTDNIETVNICDINNSLESEDKSDESNILEHKLDFQNSEVEILNKDIETSTIAEKDNTSSAVEFLDENLSNCMEDTREDSKEENVFRDTDNSTNGIKTVNICDTNASQESKDKLEESNTQINKLDFQNSEVEISYNEIEKSTVEESTNTSSVTECLDENLLNYRKDSWGNSNEENSIRVTDNSTNDIETVNICDINASIESEEKLEESNTQINELNFQNSEVEIIYQEIEKSAVGESTNTSSVTECLDENLLKCREEMWEDPQEENILRDTDNSTDNIKTVNIWDMNNTQKLEDKSEESNILKNELDFQNSEVEIPYKEIENSIVEEKTNTSSVAENLDENLLKCREEIQGDSKEENILTSTDNPTDEIKTVNICDINASLESAAKSDESNIQINKLDSQNSNVEIIYKEIEDSTIEKNKDTLNVSECLETNLLKFSEDTEVGSSEENIVRGTDNKTDDSKSINICGINAFPNSEDKPDELNIKTQKLDLKNSDGEILYKEIENSTIEEDTNILSVRECLEKSLVKYSEEMQVGFSEENILSVVDDPLDIHLDSDRESAVATDALNLTKSKMQQPIESLTFVNSDLEEIQNTFSILPEERQESRDENLFRVLESMAIEEKSLDSPTRVREVDAGDDNNKEAESSIKEEGLDANSDLERIQNAFDTAEERNNNNATLSAVLRGAELSRKRNNSRLTETPGGDVTEGGSSRDSAVFDERGTFNVPRQMDRETGERSVAVESTVTTETTFRANGDARLSTAVVSRLTLDDWSACSKGVSQGEEENSVSVQTTVSEDLFRPTFEEFVPLQSGEKISKSEAGEPLLEETFIRRNGTEAEKFEGVGSSPSSPRVDRLKGLLSRDEERRARTKFHHLADSSHVGGAMEGEWDRLLRDVLASVSELERWERRQCDVSGDAEDAEQQRRQQHHFSQSDSSFTMEEEALSPNKGETPTKVKSLRFKLDPDVFDVPSDDSFYDDDDDETRRVWKKQPRYRAFSSLELHDEPVRLVSVHASVVPAGQKMVARPVGIDLRVRLTEERQSKRAHVSTSPSQAKRRSPVSDRGIGWCQELSPVTENVDWRETFTPVTPECKSVPNGILKTPSPKTEPSPIESPNPFKLENGVTTNGVSPVIENKSVEKAKYNGWKPVERKPFLLPRKKFEPDPEAVERITGYKSALSKPPLPPPIPSKLNASLIVRNRAEQARKQYLDSKAALSANKVDGTKKFQQFLNQAQNDRARIITSVPDLAAIERAVTEQWTKERGSVSPRESPGREDNKKNDGVTLSRGSTPDDKWASYVQSCRQHLGRRSQSMTYLETDIDIIPVLDDDDKCHSTSALDEPDEALPDPDDSDLDRSREDLDDSGRAKSEHELRIERSLRSLPIPDWYRRSEKTKTGFLLGSSNKEKRGWAAAKSLASSTSSLASCGLRRPVRSLRSSRENIPWSRSSASPDGPTLSLALAKAFREPYLGWRARTPTSSGVSSSPRASPPSWGATTTDDEANGVSFDGEDAFGRTTSSEEDRRDEPLSLDDTGADAVTVSMDTNDPVKLPGGEDTCDDINNMSMDTCELFDASVVVPVDEDPSPQADTGDDIDNLSTDTTTTEGRKLDPKLKRYSYSQSIYHSEWDEEEESRGDRKGKEEDREPSPSSPDHKVVWIESSFVGSRTTTSIVVLPEKKAPGSTQERPASR